MDCIEARIRQVRSKALAHARQQQELRMRDGIREISFTLTNEKEEREQLPREGRASNLRGGRTATSSIVKEAEELNLRKTSHGLAQSARVNSVERYRMLDSSMDCGKEFDLASSESIGVTKNSSGSATTNLRPPRRDCSSRQPRSMGLDISLSSTSLPIKFGAMANDFSHSQEATRQLVSPLAPPFQLAPPSTQVEEFLMFVREVGAVFGNIFHLGPAHKSPAIPAPRRFPRYPHSASLPVLLPAGCDLYAGSGGGARELAQFLHSIISSRQKLMNHDINLDNNNNEQYTASRPGSLLQTSITATKESRRDFREQVCQYLCQAETVLRQTPQGVLEDACDHLPEEVASAATCLLLSFAYIVQDHSSSLLQVLVEATCVAARHYHRLQVELPHQLLHCYRVLLSFPSLLVYDLSREEVHGKMEEGRPCTSSSSSAIASSLPPVIQIILALLQEGVVNIASVESAVVRLAEDTERVLFIVKEESQLRGSSSEHILYPSSSSLGEGDAKRSKENSSNSAESPNHSSPSSSSPSSTPPRSTEGDDEDSIPELRGVKGDLREFISFLVRSYHNPFPSSSKKKEGQKKQRPAYHPLDFVSMWAALPNSLCDKSPDTIAQHFPHVSLITSANTFT